VKGGDDLEDIAETFVKWLTKGCLSSKDGQAFDVSCCGINSFFGIICGKGRWTGFDVKVRWLEVSFGNTKTRELATARLGPLLFEYSCPALVAMSLNALGNSGGIPGRDSNK
jgi:hypothetical protein